jgi:nucleotide-binding universal stress UspA family protein
MVRTVVAGIDGSPESRAAAEWAAHEAELRALPLKVVHVWEPGPDPMAQAPLLGAETQQHWTERVPRETAEELRVRHPGVEVGQEQLTGRPAEVLTDAAKDAELLVLGSRGMSGIGGFLVGSVGLAVIAHAEVPVVLVRASQRATDEPAGEPAGTVVLGLDVGSPDDSLIEFAFEEAARRAAALRVVHVWNLPSSYAYGLAAGMDLYDEVAQQQREMLTKVLGTWRQRFPGVEVVAESPTGGVADRLVEASREASLVVVGRRVRRSGFGSHIGSVTHAVLHHAPVPVAVVAHG